MSLTVNSLDVIEFILGTKNVAILYDDVSVAESMSLKRGYLSTVFLCLLQRPYEIQALEPTALIFLHCSTLKTPDDHEHMQMFATIIRIQRGIQNLVKNLRWSVLRN